MSEHMQVILIFGSVFTGLLTAIGSLVGVLVYFTKHQIRVSERLAEVVIPRMTQGFQKELEEQREQCHAEHEAHEEAAQERHREVLERLKTRPA